MSFRTNTCLHIHANYGAASCCVCCKLALTSNYQAWPLSAACHAATRKCQACTNTRSLQPIILCMLFLYKLLPRCKTRFVDECIIRRPGNPWFINRRKLSSKKNIGSWEKCNLKTSCCLREQFDNGEPWWRQIEASRGTVSRQRAPRVKYGGLMRKLISA